MRRTAVLRKSALSRKTALRALSPMKRKRSRKAALARHKAYWSSLPNVCPVRGAVSDIALHHILADAPGKVGRRDHMLVVKISAALHNGEADSVHMLGSEAAFLARWGVDLVAIAVANRDAWEAGQ